MESAPSLETVFQALEALYHNPDTCGKERASIWLGELQRSVYAWQISDQLLQLNHDVESCYFAAQTMRTKIQYAFHELPQTSHQSLRDSILGHMEKVTPDTSPVIVTQLCLALADLVLQMATWKDAATDLMQKFGKDTTHWPFLIELLTVMPEEINSRSLRLGANRREDVTEELRKGAPMTVELLGAVRDHAKDDFRLQARVFRCLGSWFSVGVILQDNIVNSNLLSAPFEALMNQECPSQLHEAASDCICSALYASEDLDRNVLLAQQLMQGVMMLGDAYHLSVATEDIDKSLNYCRIFTEMAESFLEMIVSTPGQGFGDFRSLELLLTAVGHHQYEVADITFNFWYRLSELLYQNNREQLSDIFKPYVHRLIIALGRHCQLDPDHEGVPAEGDEFVDFRTRVSELVRDVVFIVGSSTCFTQMFEDLKNQSSNSSWESSEAALFIMTAVAKNIMPEESEIVPQVVQAVLGLPESAHIAVRCTSVQLIGELHEWIQRHTEFLDPVLQFLLQALQQPALATVAATSLHSVCSQCQDQMTGHFQGLLHIVQSLDSFNVSNNAIIDLLKGTALILAKMPDDKITEGLGELCSLQILPLNKILEQEEVAKVTPGSKQDPTVWLDRLAAIFRHTNPRIKKEQLHPCQPVVQQIWPVLSNTCSKYKGDIRVIERCCRCIRFVIRCLGKGSATLLTPLVTQMVTLYQEFPHSCFLYLGSILVDEYGTETGCVQGLLDMLQAFCTPTFTLLEEQNGFRNHPDTVDDLFRLCLRFVQRAPIAFLQSSLTTPVVLCSITACGLDHKDANASVTKFLTELIKSGHEREDKDDYTLRRQLVGTLLTQHGQPLAQCLLNACVFCLPSYMVLDSAEVLYEMMLLDRPSVCKWLQVALEALPTTNSGGATTATHKQLADYHKAVTSAENVSHVHKATREFSRLFR